MTRFGAPQTPREKLGTAKRSEKAEKKWSAKPWDAGSPTDDGIVSWMKRQTMMEAKRGKKRPSVADAEHHFPPTQNCSEIADIHTFKANSLHDRFLPKKQKVGPSQEMVKGPVYRYTSNSGSGGGEAGRHSSSLRLQRNSDQEVGTNDEQAKAMTKSMADLRDNDSSNIELRKRELRSASVQEYHSSKQHETDRYGNKASSTYHKIKRILKFSKFGENKRQHSNVEEEEDEGYSSKTSSAETKKEGNPVEYPVLHRMCSSMIDLSELSAPESALNGYQKFKFNYTHQDSPRVPPETDSVRLDREKTLQLALRLQRVTTDPVRCSHGNYVTALPPEETTVIDLNSDSMKPMTLVLRKISIQDAEKSVPEKFISSVATPPRISPDRPTSQTGSRPSSTRTTSRLGSADKKQRVTYSRPTSYRARSSTSASAKTPPANNQGASKPEKIPHWSPKTSQTSYYDKSSNSYSIGDLLPAMDRSIYGKQPVRSNTQIQTKELSGQKGETETELFTTKTPPVSQNEEYTLLRKGMDVIAGAIEKCRKARTQLPTLGPPPFRPNQTRHPLSRDVTVVIDPKISKTNPYQYHLRSSPTHGTNRRVGSDKGPRPQQENPDKETRKKLREAFTRFYSQRPSDVGKEFRRMQTMWNT